MSEISPNIRNILEAACQAPSGENSQPWRFRVEGQQIDLYYDPQSDCSLYNEENRGSFIALGAAIENMVITAHSQGFDAEVKLFPEGLESKFVARILCNSSLRVHHDQDLAQAIMRRTTNRKKFHIEKMDNESIKALSEAASCFFSAGVIFQRVTERQDIQILGRVGSANEEVMLQNKALHSFFFSHLTWTKKDDDKKKVGFYIETLELPSPAKILFRIFGYWPIMSILKFARLPSIVGHVNASVYGSSSEMHILSILSDTSESFINVGRAFERMWLTATVHGLYLQPLTGIIFLKYSLSKNPNSFSIREKNIINRQFYVLRTIVPGGNVIALMYRIGRGKQPTARASRFSVEQLMC